MLVTVGCKSHDKNNVSVDTNYFEYKVENIEAYTVDDSGLLYTSATSIVKEDAINNNIYTYINQYNLEGALVTTYELGKKVIGISAMDVDRNLLFFTTSSYNEEGPCVSLYSYNVDNETLKQLADFNNFETVSQIVYMDGVIYVLGNRTHVLASNLSEEAYQTKGEQIVSYCLKDGQMHEIEIVQPIKMAQSDNGTLMIHSYLESKGYCMLEYKPSKDTITEKAYYDSYMVENFAVCDEGKKIIYTYSSNSRGLVMSDIDNIHVQAEICPNAAIFNSDIYYNQGQVYCMNQTRNILRFDLEPQKKNDSIKYISLGFEMDAPFGCGYYMERQDVDEQKFALKVLAQDKDYDLCLGNSSYGSSYNIRKNGVFYPLNKVDGIEEYLDRCFPYVRESATNESGDIWMLPIGVDIPSLLVKEDCLQKYGVSLHNNITYEEFYQLQEQMDDDRYKMTSCNSYVNYLNFFAQYFNKYSSLKEEVFMKQLKLFQTYDLKLPQKLNYISDLEGDFLYAYYKYQAVYRILLEQSQQIEGLSFYSFPKLDKDDKNVGTCFYLAVNPNSTRLEETLDYLSSYIHYTMGQEKMPLFFKDPIPKDGTLEKSLYDVYENGDITFCLDENLYWDGFDEVVQKKLSEQEYIEDTDRKLDVYFQE